MRRFTTLSLLICLTFTMIFENVVQAQPFLQEKRIYIVDVTGSMEGRGVGGTRNIFQTVKDNLVSTLQRIDDRKTEVVVIPFTSHPFPEFNGRIAEKDSLTQYINGLSIQKGNTNIADAWTKGVSCVDSTKINYIFLLTDGLHNCGPKTEELYNRLRAWEEQSQDKYMFAFYVMLTPDAKEMEICRIVDETRNLWLIESMNIDASLISLPNYIRKNVFDDKTISLHFETNNSNVDLSDIGVEISMDDDPYYGAANVEKSFMGAVFKVSVEEKVEKKQIPITDTVELKINHNREKYPFVFFTPEQIKVVITNQGPRNLSVSSKQKKEKLDENLSFGKLAFNEPFLGPFKYLRAILEPTLEYPPFSWFKPDTLIVANTLYFSFNEEALRSNANLRIRLADETGCGFDDVVLTCSNDSLIVASDTTSVVSLSVGLIPGRESTDLKGKLVLDTQGLDFVNGMELSSNNVELCDWSLDYRRRGAWGIWLIWLLCLALIVYLIYWILKGLFLLLGVLGDLGGTPQNVAPSTVKNSNKRQKMKENAICPCNDKIVKICSKIISDGASIAVKCQIVEKLADFWETAPRTETDEIYRRMCPKVRDMLERYWAIPKPSPSEKYGRWVRGTKGNGVFYFNDDYLPAEKNTRGGMSWGELVREYKKDFDLKVDGGVEYHNNRIVIEPYSIAKVKIRYEDSNLDKISSRGGSSDSFQQMAGEQFEKILESQIRKGGYKDFWEFKDGRKGSVLVRKTPLVIHEDYDGTTLYLVPKYLHDNWKHYGGVSVVNAVLGE